MADIRPVTPPYSVIRTAKINKDDKKPPDKQPQGEKKPALEEQDTPTHQHIDEIV